MNKISLCCILSLAFLNTASAADDMTPKSDPSEFCFFAGVPPAEFPYKVIRKVKVAKGTYGGVSELVGDLSQRAKDVGGDAIVNYAGSQRFGVLPWRLIRPVVRGEAIKWTGAAPDCEKAGGSTLTTIIRTNKAPGQSGQADAPDASEAPEPAPETAPAK
ncbi:hypothetical protein F2P44_20045 [Massilia sp. CCM 8695]|uniref:Uncharacterized protein n=1 Tax=Massilia frigida TaxID=2609281 RepID=A0ABX0NE90_9BURK|nr:MULTISPECIES: hypothetical protein [Massilia]MDM5179242.1 hypothetical protein [Massilia sp. DJPM01]NHZ81551.1 hypothetical protein [Massilia frigida]